MNDIQHLADALRKAFDAAVAAEPDNDGGSANMDRPTINLQGWKKAEINQASNMSSVRVGDKIQSSWWKNSREVYIPQKGQGYKLTAMAEACVTSLRESGYSAAVYYQVD